MGRWHYEDTVWVTDPDTNTHYQIYIQSSGLATQEDFEIDNLVAYYEDGNERQLKIWEEEDIEDFLQNNDELYQQAYERSVDDAYDRENDR